MLRSATGSGNIDNPASARSWRSARRCAQIIDREAIAKNAYDDTVDAAVLDRPARLRRQPTRRSRTSTASPNVDAAKQILDDAGIKTPVDLTLGLHADALRPERRRRGDRVPAPARGERSVQGRGQERGVGAVPDHRQGRCLRPLPVGWFPDFLDADNYLAPFMVDGGFFQNGYTNAEVNDLVADEQAQR